MKLLCTLCFSLFLASLNAQVDEGQDKFYGPMSETDMGKSGILAVTVDPLQYLASGVIPISLQVNIADVLKLEIGAGPAYRDPIPFISGVNINENVELETGFGYQVGLKYYPQYYIFDDGGYFGFQYISKTQRYTSELRQESGELKHTNLSFIYGYDFRINDDLFIEAYGGLGILQLTPEYLGTQTTFGVGYTAGVKIGYLLF